VDRHGFELASSELSDTPIFNRVEDTLVDAVFASGRRHVMEQPGLIAFAAPITDPQGTLVAVARVDLNRKEAASKVVATMQRGFWLAVFGLGLAMPLTGLALSRAMRPVRELTKAAERAARKDFNQQVSIRTGDELQVLGDAFNEMVQQTSQSMKRIRKLAYVDELTGLPNKAAFNEMMQRAIDDASVPGVVLLINLDRFKRLNDTFGEREGDRLLVAASEPLRCVIASLPPRHHPADARPPVLSRFSLAALPFILCPPIPLGCPHPRAT